MARSILVVSRQTDTLSLLRAALDNAGLSDLKLDQAPSATLARRILEVDSSQILAVVVDLAEQDKALRLIADLRLSPAWRKVYCSAVTPASARVAQDWFEAGRHRVLWDAADLPKALESVASDPPITNSARLVLFAPAQEGAGASTTALHTAITLRKRYGKRILLAELDYHSDSLVCRLRLRGAKSLADLRPADDWRTVLADWEGLHVLAAPQTARLFRRGQPGLPNVLADTGFDYDLVVVDLPCNTAVAAGSVLSAADRIYVVATAELTSLHLARRRIDELCSVGADRNVVRLIVNRDRHGVVDSEVARQVTGLAPCCRLPNDFAAASEAEAQGRAISDKSPLAIAYARVATDILNRSAPAAEEPVTAWSRLLAWRPAAFTQRLRS